MKYSCLTLRRAHAVVEFALAFPVFLSLVMAGVDLWLASLEKIRLSYVAHSLVRRLAQSEFETGADLEAAAQNWLDARQMPAQVLCSVRSLPQRDTFSSYRRKKEVQLIQLSLSRHFKPQFPVMKAAFLTKPLLIQSQAEQVRVYALAQ